MNNKYKILLVEDEDNIRRFVQALLEAENYQVIEASSCNMAKTMYYSHTPDLVILDLGLPDEDGVSFLFEIRKSDITPVIVLSARNDEKEKVTVLDLGANDYITKPFGSEELLARVRSALRFYRLNTSSDGCSDKDFKLYELFINYESRQVFLYNEEIKLTQTEYNILALLSYHRGKVLTYSHIIREIWHEGKNENSIKKLQVNMANIRKKLGITPGENKYIVNELGIGYRMNNEI